MAHRVNVDSTDDFVMWRTFEVVAEEWLPFAVVVDILMPGVTGLELARRLRAGVLTGDMLLVAFTARASQGDRTRALEAGFDVHCAKPLTPSPLLTVLESIVGW